MTPEARTIAGITLITVPSIQYGGYFLLKSLMDRGSRYMDNPLRQNFFRAGHAHAGVIVLLSVAIGLPFFVVSTSAPLLQKWFAETGHPSSKDPYFLYAASNFGSLLALIAYPAVVEPNLRIIH